MQVLHHQAGMKGEQICQKPTCFIIQQLVKLMLPFPRFCSDTTGLQALVTASHYFQAAAKTSDQLPAPHVNLVPLTAPVPISYFLTKLYFCHNLCAMVGCHALLNWPLKPRTIFYCKPQRSRCCWTAGGGMTSCRFENQRKIMAASASSDFPTNYLVYYQGLMKLESCNDEMLDPVLIIT